MPVRKKFNAARLAGKSGDYIDPQKIQQQIDQLSRDAKALKKKLKKIPTSSQQLKPAISSEPIKTPVSAPIQPLQKAAVLPTVVENSVELRKKLGTLSRIDEFFKTLADEISSKVDSHTTKKRAGPVGSYLTYFSDDNGNLKR